MEHKSNKHLHGINGISRRDMLRSCATFLAMGGISNVLTSCIAPQNEFSRAPAALPSTVDITPELEIALAASQSKVSILPGAPTVVWRYRGEVLKGDPASLQELPGSYLGPIIRAHKGQKVRIHFHNELDEATNVHWHGLIAPPDMDGHPRDVVKSGAIYAYEFEVKNRAGAYWFHPHPHRRTAAQVYNGLAGLFLVSDDEEQAVGLPAGAQEIPLVLQDRAFDENNQLVYLSANTMDEMMDEMMGFLGDRILVNGQVNYVLPVATRAYRLRLLNGSNSRIFKLAWSNGIPMTVIATDGGLLAAPIQREYVTLAPAERVELWVDFSEQPVGAELKLQSLAYTGVEAGMMGGMMDAMVALPNGAPFDVLTVQVERQEAESLKLPVQLAAIERYRLDESANQANPRRFSLFMDGQMNWTINGRVFEMDNVAGDEKVKLNDLEVWEFVNEMPVGGMMMGGMGSMTGQGHTRHGNMATQNGMMGDFMAHPIHIHGIQFQVVERQIAQAQMAGWQSVKDGYVDEGWKDTVLVMPGERVKLLMRFADFAGLYVYHCHNLEHEDTTMMRNYLIQT